MDKKLYLLLVILLSVQINGTNSVNGEQLIARVVWEYRETPDFYSFWGGDADRLPNGNTLITDTVNGRILEVTPEGEKVWEVFLKNKWGRPTYLYRSERIIGLEIPISKSKLYNPEGWSIPNNITVTLWKPEKASNGITFLGAWGYMWGINMTGHAIWRYEGIIGAWLEEKLVGENHFLLLSLFDYGYYAFGEIREIDLDGNIIFKLRDRRIHHDVLKISDNEIMYLKQVKRWGSFGPIGDEIRVRNIQNKRIVWTWNTHWRLPWDQGCPVCLEKLDNEKWNSWTHSNSITFAVENGNPVVYLDVRNFNQIIKIDYNTKKIIWKLGEKGDFRMFEKDGTEVSKLFSHQHDPEFLPNGHILLFDNGLHRGGANYSRVIEIEITRNFGGDSES